MLLYLDQSISDFIDDKTNFDDAFIVALENIASARRCGNHLIFAESDIFLKISTIDSLSQPARKVYLKSHNQVIQMKSIFDYLKIYINVTLTSVNIRESSVNGKRIIEMPLSYFSNPAYINKTIILSENLDDCSFYEVIANFAPDRILQGVKIQAEPRSGGGSTTHTVFSDIQHTQERFCLCILDSDSKYQGHTPTGTLSKVKQIDLPEKPLTQLSELDCHEIENLIPSKIFEILVHDDYALDPNKEKWLQGFKELEKSCVPQAKLYLDLKKGLKLYEMKDGNSSHFFRYWNPIVSSIESLKLDDSKQCSCSTKNSCSCFIFFGMGEMKLSYVIDFLNTSKGNIAIKDSVIDSLNELAETKTLWHEISEQVWAWCCGATQMT